MRGQRVTATGNDERNRAESTSARLCKTPLSTTTTSTSRITKTGHVERHGHVRGCGEMIREDGGDDRSAPDVWRDQEVLAPRAVVAAVAPYETSVT